MLGANLNDDANQNESLIFALCADTLPPNLESKRPIFGTTDAPSFGKDWLEQLIFGDQRSLPAAHNEQLLIVGLVQADADWQVEAHAPIFDLAGESAIHGVDDEDCKGEDVHGEEGEEHERDVAHSEDGMLAVCPGEEACRVEEEGVDGDEDDVGDAIAVEILWSEIESAWVEVDHYDGLS